MSTEQETLGGTQDDVPPMIVFQSAEAFLTEADRARDRWKERSVDLTLIEAMPIYFLYGHAIELMFKAFLRSRGLGSRELAKPPFGHDLVELYRACRRNLLYTDPHCLSMIGIIAEHYSLADWHIKFKYMSDFRERFPTFDAVSIFSRVLLEAIQPVCEGMEPLEAAMQAIQLTQSGCFEPWSIEQPYSSKS
jgi:hypothetical protein